MAFINEKRVNWDLTTPNSGLLLKEEYEQLYDNDNYLKTEVEKVDTNLNNLDKDYFTYGIVQGFEVSLSAATGCVDVSEGIARDQAGRRMQRSAETGYGITDGETVKVICRFTDTEIIIDDISASQAPADNELVLAQVTRSGEAVTIVDERTFAGLVVNNIDHPQGVLIEGERVAAYRVPLLELALSNLHQRTIISFTGTFNSICFGNSTFYVVGSDGTIKKEYIDMQWLTCSVSGGYTGSFNGICYGDGIYVAVGDAGQIQTSEGTSFTSKPAADSYTGDFQAVCYGDGRFVAVGTDGEIQTSDNGDLWSSQTVDDFTDTFHDICYGNGKYVAVGKNLTIYTSPDGEGWTKVKEDSQVTCNSICYANGIFVLTVVGVHSTLRYSTDGITWQIGSIYPGNPNISFRDVCYGNGIFVALIDDGDVATSPDGKTWTRKYNNVSGSFNSISYGDDMFVVVGDNGSYLLSNIITLP